MPGVPRDPTRSPDEETKMSSDDLYPRMYIGAIERHHEMMDDLLKVVAEGGSTADVVRRLVWQMECMDVLTDWDEDAIKAAWTAAGGSDEDYPVRTVSGDDFGFREAVGP